MREIFLLEHNGRLLWEFRVMKTRGEAESRARDAHVINSLKPSATLKIFAPNKYEELMGEFQPPKVVRFVESAEEV